MSDILEPAPSWNEKESFRLADHLQSGYGGGWTVTIGTDSVEIDVNEEYGLTFTHQEYIQFTSEVLARMTVKAANATTADPQATYPKESHPAGGNA